jgi:hypothetical protein
MKKSIALLLLIAPVFGSAQTRSDIFNQNTPLVFFGADFSRIQFTKSDKFTNKPDILRFFVDCNNLLEDDAFQKLIKRKLNRDEIKSDFSLVTKINAGVDWQIVYSDNTGYTLSDETITEMITKLDINQELYRNHLGMVLCEENYSKTNLLGKVAVVFFSINDLKPVLIKHYSFKPSGYGFLFYWYSVNYYTVRSLGKLKKEIK